MAKKKLLKSEPTNALTVEAIKHDDDRRKNIPTAEYQSVMQKHEQSPIRLTYERRNKDIDPQLVWRGKDEQDWSDLVVHAPPLYIQEKVHPKVLIDDLLKLEAEPEKDTGPRQLDLFADFNGVPHGADKTEFYLHDQNWSNRMILGDSLQVMASLAEREGLRGKVQCIYLDPPYGIKFNSNFQWSTTTKDVKDGNQDHISREPEQVKAFRDTWRDGIHSYLTYLRDRLTIARDLLAETGSIFVQIGDENMHRVRDLLDEVFGAANFSGNIVIQKGGGLGSSGLKRSTDYILWYARNLDSMKYRQLYRAKVLGQGDGSGERYDQIESPDFRTTRSMTPDERSNPELVPEGWRAFQLQSLTKPGPGSRYTVDFQGKKFEPSPRWWGTTPEGMKSLIKSGRVAIAGKTIRYKQYLDDFEAYEITNLWDDVAGAANKVYVVQTSTAVVQRCLLMVTDPGDLVLDPTCGSGTTAYIAEHWGRRWITIDTSRVALALARARIMGAKYPYYLLADSPEGQIKEADIRKVPPSGAPTSGKIRQGFVNKRIPKISPSAISNNTEIEIIWEKHQKQCEQYRQQLNSETKSKREEYEIPATAEESWSQKAKDLLDKWWHHRTLCQKEIDASIAAKAAFEFLYDSPFENKKKVRVAGPFTVESISPHRVLPVDENDELVQASSNSPATERGRQSFPEMILENLKRAGVQQAHKEDKIIFESLEPWPGHFVCGEGKYKEGASQGGSLKRAAIFIGPEFGTVTRPDLVAAAREAGDADFDVLVACAFNYEAHATEFSKLGRIPVIKARMNADLHMSDDLKNNGKGNLFVIFGEPDIDLIKEKTGHLKVKVNGVDVFDPSTGEVRSDGADGIACWFIDTDYNEESFFVRHAYFLGANDPYKALKSTLKAEIDEEAWESLHSDVSRPFKKPKSGRIAVKVINHLGDEVMKVFKAD